MNADKQQENNKRVIGRPFPKGISGNPKGRPKGKTIKEHVREWLENNPDDMEAFVKHFVKTNRDLAWRMLEGNPPQKLSGDPDAPLQIIVPKEVAEAFGIKETKDETNTKTSGSD